MGLFGNKSFDDVIDDMEHREPMRYQGLLCDMETNLLTLEAFRKWLSRSEWYEKILLSEEYPEFEFIGDDMMILEMQHDLLASLN
jgi:hypothetical protein